MNSSTYFQQHLELAYPKVAPLGRDRIMLRLLNQGDREFFLDLFRDADDEDVLLLKEDFKNPLVVEDWFDRLDYRQVLPLGAVDVNRHCLVGVSLLHRGPRAARLNGEICLFVAEPYRNSELAALLLEEVLHLAAKGGLRWLSAEVIRDCRPLVQTFQDRGFAVKATFEQYLCRTNGATRDVVLLMRPPGKKIGKTPGKGAETGRAPPPPSTPRPQGTKT